MIPTPKARTWTDKSMTLPHCWPPPFGRCAPPLCPQALSAHLYSAFPANVAKGLHVDRSRCDADVENAVGRPARGGPGVAGRAAGKRIPGGHPDTGNVAQLCAQGADGGGGAGGGRVMDAASDRVLRYLGVQRHSLLSVSPG